MARHLRELRAEFTALPEWARERAAELANACCDINGYYHSQRRPSASFHALANYIAEHEQPPVDPKLLRARELLAKHYNNPDYLNGEHDDTGAIRAIMEALLMCEELNGK